MTVRPLKVKGTLLTYQDYNGDWRGEEGIATGETGTPSKVKISGNRIYYNDFNGAERYLPFEDVGPSPHTPGKIWIKGKWIHYTIASA